MSGQAGRTPAAKAKPAILTATIQITRAATGKVEEYEIVGTQEDAAGAPLCGLDTVRQERGRFDPQPDSFTTTE